jgi:hypothetical protein
MKKNAPARPSGTEALSIATTTGSISVCNGKRQALDPIIFANQRKAERERLLQRRAAANLEAAAADLSEILVLKGSPDGSGLFGPIRLGELEATVHVRRIRGRP